jgi:two-component system, LytTR family, sensor histidine kinase AlgZ
MRGVLQGSSKGLNRGFSGFVRLGDNVHESTCPNWFHSIERRMPSPTRSHPGRRLDAAADSGSATPSLIDSMWLEPGARVALPPSKAGNAINAFNVCHVGVVLRTVVFVHGVLALGLLFTHNTAVAWLEAFSVAAGVVLPGVLCWLSMACLAKTWFARMSTAQQWMFGGSLGAVAAWVSWALGAWSGLSVWAATSVATDALPAVLAPMLAGTALALGVTLWLQWREQARFPAEATARLAELQSRIRPHFLFNTLNTALALVRLDPTRAEGVLEDLSELFRVALSESGESTTLEGEIDLARRYLAIEQIRFGDRLKVQWELDPAAGSARVPPLLLQPLVENAVHHGVEPSEEGGLVRIRTRVMGGRVQVSIVNTVPNVSPRPGHGMALHNVKERLRLMHDVTGQFETRLHDGIFRVQITIPLGEPLTKAAP